MKIKPLRKHYVSYEDYINELEAYASWARERLIANDVYETLFDKILEIVDPSSPQISNEEIVEQVRLYKSQLEAKDKLIEDIISTDEGAKVFLKIQGINDSDLKRGLEEFRKKFPELTTRKG